MKSPGSALELLHPRDVRRDRSALDFLWRRGGGRQSRWAPCDAITLCEIKYSEKPFVIDEFCARSLLHKKECFIRHTQTNKQVFAAFVAPHGVAENLYADELTGGVVTLDDFF